MSLIYNYSYGDESLLGSTITIFKSNNIYDIIFKQQHTNDKYFKNIYSNYELISKDVIDNKEHISDVLSINSRIIKMKILCNINPPPENIFIVK